MGKDTWLRQAAKTSGNDRSVSSPQQKADVKEETNAQKQSRLLREAKARKIKKAKALRKAGYSASAICRQLQISPKTTRKYLQSDPKAVIHSRRTRRKIIDRFHKDLWRLWQEGMQATPLLFRNLQSLGYQGSYRTLQRYVAQWREKRPQFNGKPNRIPSAREIKFWITKDEEKLKDEEKAFLHRLLEQNPWEGWLLKAKSSRIQQLKNFAKGLEKDRAVVEGAITSKWSNGQVEGQVN